MISAEWKLNLRTEQAASEINAIIFEETEQAFKSDILQEAESRSPVLSGTNVASIDTTTVDTPKGPLASLFTTDGYGGYLEVGTKKMKAQPYLYPAFLHGIIPLLQRIYRRVQSA